MMSLQKLTSNKVEKQNYVIIIDEINRANVPQENHNPAPDFPVGQTSFAIPAYQALKTQNHQWTKSCDHSIGRVLRFHPTS